MPTVAEKLFFISRESSTPLNLHNLEEPAGYRVVSAIGVGAPPVSISTSQYASRSGASITSTSIPGREFELLIDVQGTDLESRDRLYDQLIRHLYITYGSDVEHLGILEHHRPDGQIRGIRCGAIRGLEIDRRAIANTPFGYRLPVRFYAEHPFWIDKRQAVQLTRLEQRGGIELPSELGWTSSTQLKALPHIIQYEGSAATFSLEWRIYGPAKRPALWHEPSGRIVQIETEIASGQIIVVNMGNQQSITRGDLAQFGPGRGFLQPEDSEWRYRDISEFTIRDSASDVDLFSTLSSRSAPIYIAPKPRSAFQTLWYFSEYSDAELNLEPQARKDAVLDQVSEISFNTEYLDW